MIADEFLSVCWYSLQLITSKSYGFLIFSSLYKNVSLYHILSGWGSGKNSKYITEWFNSIQCLTFNDSRLIHSPRLESSQPSGWAKALCSPLNLCSSIWLCSSLMLFDSAVSVQISWVGGVRGEQMILFPHKWDLAHSVKGDSSLTQFSSRLPVSSIYIHAIF